MVWNGFRDWLCPDLGIDLGTANTRIVVRGKGLVVDEPSVVAMEKGSRRVLGQGTAVGRLARQMMGRTPDSITAVQPLRSGSITDFEVCESMLRYLMRKAASQSGGFRPRVVVTVPCELTPVEKHIIFNSVERAGAGRVYLVEQSRAASIGAGLPISEPIANMICDLGSGTSEIAVLSLAEIVAGKSLKVAGDSMDEAIVEYVRREFSLRIGTRTAERLKISIGSAFPLDEELTTEVRGLDIVSSIPRKALITSEQVRAALQEPLGRILEGITSVIERCAPELVADLAETGIVLCGGSAQLRGIDSLLREQLGIPIRIASDPLTTTARGTAICLDHLQHWRGRFESEAA
ncbi:MAG: rod shape-determining protein [Planctomycetaceae bacterium]|nr:rod shape-determining protein [Planctomycetaceae bacterium]MCA9029257.1 rod shape-determining protein [Planctomycetaceae bacterium]MCA9043261.1 rod shape-determining protein [Planctomycetaceae bacterium]MCB9954210.1 rod shape-determining protein [Planctomycetaceae bacterium]